MSRISAPIEIVVKMLDTVEDRNRAAFALLCAAERQRAGRFAFERDRRRYIAARAHLRRLLGERLGEAPEAIEFVYGRRGKPALAPRLAASRLRFNLAHCGDVAVYAFAQGREIGVDVEEVRALHDADHVAARFFSPRENQDYQALGAAQRAQGFFNCWTRKEAFIKALGGGLHVPLGCFDVTLVPGEPARILRLGRRPGEGCGWQLVDLQPAPGFAGAAVVRAQSLPVSGMLH